MFAAFVLETEYLTLRQFGQALEAWLSVFGVVAMCVLLLWEGVRLLRRRGSLFQHGLSGRLTHVHEHEVWKKRTLWLFFGIIPVGLIGTAAFGQWSTNPQGGIHYEWSAGARYSFLAACAAAILALSWEFLLDLISLSPRRVWAIARLSIKEAIRRKALWSFCIVLVVFLFASWFIKTDRPEDQWRAYVNLIFFVMAGLILLTASVLACFSLPSDIKQNTIHTVVTKPVEKFEIVLGKVLGFGILMTIVLVIVAHLSLVYVLRGIGDEARSSLRARVALAGDLRMEELSPQGGWVPRERGDSVGREWEYRSYIRGGSTQEAVWRFHPSTLPAGLSQLDRIPIEFSFDIFRTSKGGETPQEGVSCQITFVNSAKWDYSRYNEYREGKNPTTGLPLTEQERAEAFGYYELPSPLNVIDYKSYIVTFPSGVLKDIENGDLEIRVNCRSHSQYLGVARHDLHILAAEGSFYLNFLKGTAGIWFLSMMVITLGVVFTTYLNALVSLMLTWLLMFCGLPRILPFVFNLTQPFDPQQNPGGGPLESLVRLMRQDNLVVPLEPTTAIQLVKKGDEVIQIFFKGLVSILPDINQYDRTLFVAEGFNIPRGDLLMNALLLVGYLFPFLLAGYYLINAREVAS